MELGHEIRFSYKNVPHSLQIAKKSSIFALAFNLKEK